MVAIVDHEASSIVDDRAMNASVPRPDGDLDASGRGVLLDIVQGFRNLAEDDGFDLVSLVVRQPELDLCFDAGHRAHHRHPVADRLFEPSGHLEGRRPHLEEKLAQRLFRLVEKLACVHHRCGVVVAGPL